MAAVKIENAFYFIYIYIRSSYQVRAYYFGYVLLNVEAKFAF